LLFALTNKPVEWLDEGKSEEADPEFLDLRTGGAVIY
jgi:hypothetical protein